MYFFSQLYRKKITAVCAGEALANGCCFVSVNSRGLMGFHSYPLMLGAVKLPHIYVCRGDKKEKRRPCWVKDYLAANVVKDSLGKFSLWTWQGLKFVLRRQLERIGAALIMKLIMRRCWSFSFLQGIEFAPTLAEALNYSYLNTVFFFLFSHMDTYVLIINWILKWAVNFR